jgi:hypothetical protein
MPRASSVDIATPRGWTTGWVSAAILLVSFAIYALTISDVLWTTDVFGANWTSWHIATTGTPWIDGSHIPDVGNRPQNLLAIVHTINGHTSFNRFPGVVIASLPAYLIASGPMSTIPGSLTAAFLTSCALVLMFQALRRHAPLSHAVVATTVFGFATPVWTVSANLMWPHTLTILGMAGMAWAASTGRWWWVGIFGGVALSGRIHTALVIMVLALGVGIRRRDPMLVAKAAAASAPFLVAICGWNRWVYGSWSPWGGYNTGTGTGVADAGGSYRFDVPNYLGMWVSPDRGILIWTPVVAVLLPALVRSWRHLPEWSRFLLLGGLAYTLLQSSLIGFDGGTGFYGYRYGLEFLACATPALVLSTPRLGRAARQLIGPVLAVQGFAFLLGGLYANLYLPGEDAWRQNAFVHTIDRIGLAGWIVTALVACLGWFVARRVTASRGRTEAAVCDKRTRSRSSST